MTYQADYKIPQSTISLCWLFPKSWIFLFIWSPTCLLLSEILLKLQFWILSLALFTISFYRLSLLQFYSIHGFRDQMLSFTRLCCEAPDPYVFLLDSSRWVTQSHLEFSMPQPDPTAFPLTPTFPLGFPAQWTTPLSAHPLNSEIWESSLYPPSLLPSTTKGHHLHSSWFLFSLPFSPFLCWPSVPPAFRVTAIAFCLAVPTRFLVHLS